ncbi:reverse transcriptase family protein [Aeromonas caviae]|uniref:reverse transcriptase family protein n=1 Tax=Aeromonas caviae TaxID=648 RepID=UPI00244A6B46|nr:reverse transcriptase family protein [Aeromonas caviae]MDH1993775.1 reverse transcriptase family protein [Aeromonas caviae]
MKAAPLLVSFNSIEKYLDALQEDKSSVYSGSIKELVDKSYPPIVSVYCLSVLFGYSFGFVYSLLKRPDKFYRNFSINQGKKIRRISSPKVALKVIQKWFGYHLSRAIEFPPHVFGFVSGRSFADAAAQHIGARWIFSIDIVDFFPSITERNISDSLKTIGYSSEGADLAAGLCCLNGVLAQGSPASPVLSNIFMMSVDEEILRLAKKYSLTVTRYADDIVFSGNDDFDEGMMAELALIFSKTPFKINNEKKYFADANKGQRLKVHGLLVKEERINLTKGYRNKLRAYRHMLKEGKIKEGDVARINGHLKFGEFIERKSGGE